MPQPTSCEDSYWTGACTACPGYWYQGCEDGYTGVAERGCGTLGCEIQCRYDSDDCVDVNCEVSDFGEWSECSVSCGEGTQSRTRTITQDPLLNGTACPELEETRACNTQDCPVMPQPTSCEDSYWTGACTACPGYWYQGCEDGYTGVAERGCGILGCEIQCRYDSDDCVDVNCEVSDFGEWSECSVSCGDGTQTRTRTITQDPLLNGNACPELVETRACNNQECPQPSGGCADSYWTGECTACPGYWYQGCRDGYDKFAERGCGTLGCEIQCRNENAECVDVDCEVSDFGEWSECSETCGDGTQTRTRTITQDPMHNGAACPELVETQTCKIQECPVHCEMSDWSDFSECSETCGEGVRARTRTVTTEAMHGGDECPSALETAVCKDAECPVDCEVSDFTEWGDCNVTCDPGLQIRFRSVTQDALHGGAECPALSETRDCAWQEACDCTTKTAYDARCLSTTSSRICTQKYGCRWNNEECAPVAAGAKIKCSRLLASKCNCYTGCKTKISRGKLKCTGTHRFQ